MKCPYCNYFHGWNPEEQEYEEGDKGVFYELPIQVERFGDFMKVYGCPACRKIFMED